MTGVTAGYAFANDWTKARERLSGLEDWLDDVTIHHLRALGPAEGWSVLEVGAGGGSIARWLCDEVGASGRVTAIDIDTRFLENLNRSNLSIRRADIARDELADSLFDLAHCRLLLAHIPNREGALRRMISAVRPGGWVVAEEMDFASVGVNPAVPEASNFMACAAFCDAAERARGFDPEYGRRLVAGFVAEGLTAVESSGRADILAGGSPDADVWRLSFEQLFDEMVANGAHPEQIEAAIACCRDPSFSFLSQVTITAWGRRP